MPNNSNIKLTFLSILLLKQLITLNAKLASDTRYPPVHETYCPMMADEDALIALNAENTIKGIENLSGISVCQKLKLKSHYCTHIYKAPASARLHKFFKVKVKGVRYECKFSYIANCETQVELLRQCFKFQHMPDMYLRLFQG